VEYVGIVRFVDVADKNDIPVTMTPAAAFSLLTVNGTLSQFIILSHY
jgi:hypothetical protein